jgi:hypothetical protein
LSSPCRHHHREKKEVKLVKLKKTLIEEHDQGHERH